MPDATLVLYGCGTQGQAILEWIRTADPQRELVLTDDNPELWGRYVSGLPIVPPENAFCYPSSILCGIGDNTTRARVLQRARTNGQRWDRFIHPTAVIAPSAEIGEGTVLLAHTVLNSCSRIGAGCLINTGAIVEHHCCVENFVHLAPRAALAGGVHVGEGSLVGVGAVALPGTRIGSFAILGAGAVLTQNVPAGQVFAGNPARMLYPASSLRV